MCAAAAVATGRRDVADIAYGFIGSKALFAALEIGLFTSLADGPRLPDELAVATAVAPHRLTTLLRALAAVGLVVPDGDGYRNSPAAQRHLVRGTRGDIGEYYRRQISRQIYPALVHLDAGLAGKGVAFEGFADLMADLDEATTFSVGQHNGSLDVARTLADRLPLPGARRLLDVGAGSGAFSIAFCERNPELSATLLDFPHVLDVAREYRDAAGLGGRIDLVAGDATHAGWPGEQDVVLMSYLVSALRADEVDDALAAAHASLRPGGLLVVHDFLLDDDAAGPATSALWFLQYLAWQPDARSFTGAELAARLHSAGFAPGAAAELIPETTKVVLARKVATS
jgi:2-hydroxy-4-(methylsulfanyl)butanoate S-methyltransferase